MQRAALPVAATSAVPPPPAVEGVAFTLGRRGARVILVAELVVLTYHAGPQRAVSTAVYAAALCTAGRTLWLLCHTTRSAHSAKEGLESIWDWQPPLGDDLQTGAWHVLRSLAQTAGRWARARGRGGRGGVMQLQVREPCAPRTVATHRGKLAHLGQLTGLYAGSEVQVSAGHPSHRPPAPLPACCARLDQEYPAIDELLSQEALQPAQLALRLYFLYALNSSEPEWDSFDQVWAGLAGASQAACCGLLDLQGWHLGHLLLPGPALAMCAPSPLNPMPPTQTLDPTGTCPQAAAQAGAAAEYGAVAKGDLEALVYYRPLACFLYDIAADSLLAPALAESGGWEGAAPHPWRPGAASRPGWVEGVAPDLCCTILRRYLASVPCPPPSTELMPPNPCMLRLLWWQATRCALLHTSPTWPPVARPTSWRCTRGGARCCWWCGGPTRPRTCSQTCSPQVSPARVG